MTLKSDAKFEGKLSCGLENNMRNLANFYQSIWKSQNWVFDGILLSKVENVWAYNLQRTYMSWQWGMSQNLQKNWFAVSKFTWAIWRILTGTLKCLKNVHFNGLLLTKLYNVSAKKKYRRVMFNGTADWCKIWRKTDLCFQ